MHVYLAAVLLRDKETSEACLHAAMGKQIEKIPVWNVDAYQIRIILAIIAVPPVDGLIFTLSEFKLASGVYIAVTARPGSGAFFSRTLFTPSHAPNKIIIK